MLVLFELFGKTYFNICTLGGYKEQILLFSLILSPAGEIKYLLSAFGLVFFQRVLVQKRIVNQNINTFYKNKIS